jgi:hypothetical protein
MTSIKIRVYLFYVAAVLFAALGFWMISRALFGDGGITALVVGAALLLTGIVDYWMGGYLKKLYLDPPSPPAAGKEPSQNG